MKNLTIALFTIVATILTSCGDNTPPKPVYENYAAITLEDGTRGALYLPGAYSHMMTSGSKVYVRSGLTPFEAELYPDALFLVTNVSPDSVGVQRGTTCFIESDIDVDIRVGALATPATIDSLFQITK